jgi:hypothetical protein
MEAERSRAGSRGVWAASLGLTNGRGGWTAKAGIRHSRRGSSHSSRAIALLLHK